MIREMDTESRHSLADLARVTGVTPRTVRYYIVQGLLPGANDAGPGAWYDERHLARLRLIRELQRQHLPLAEIRARLAGLTDFEVAGLLADQAGSAEVPAESALDYIRGLLGTQRRNTPSLLMPVDASGSALGPASTPARPGQLMRTRVSGPEVVSDAASAARAAVPLRRAMVVGAITDHRATPDAPATPTTPASTEAPAAATPAPPAAPAGPGTRSAAERSQWDRIALTDDIELHVRRPLSRLDNKRVERLITIARQVLGEEQP